MEVWLNILLSFVELSVTVVSVIEEIGIYLICLLYAANKEADDVLKKLFSTSICH